MLASLLRPKKRRVYADRSPFSPWYTAQDSPLLPHETRVNDHRRFATGGNVRQTEPDDGRDEDEDEDEAEHDPESAPLLPLFSASHLGTGGLDCPVQLADSIPR